MGMDPVRENEVGEVTEGSAGKATGMDRARVREVPARKVRGREACPGKYTGKDIEEILEGTAEATRETGWEREGVLALVPGLALVSVLVLVPVLALAPAPVLVLALVLEGGQDFGENCSLPPVEVERVSLGMLKTPNLPIRRRPAIEVTREKYC